MCRVASSAYHRRRPSIDKRTGYGFQYANAKAKIEKISSPWLGTGWGDCKGNGQKGAQHTKEPGGLGDG